MTAAVGLARYELRLLGGAALGTPFTAIGVFDALAGLFWFLGASDETLARLLAASLEVGLPLGAGVAAAGIVADDPAIGLQLALKTRYRSTIARRLGLLVLWCSALAVASTLVLYLTGTWSVWVPENLLAGQLVWLSPLLWYVAAGALLSLLTGSRTAAGTILGGLSVAGLLFRWIFLLREWPQLLYPFATVFTPGAGFWLANRGALLAFALALTAVAWAPASDSEWLSKGDER